MKSKVIFLSFFFIVGTIFTVSSQCNNDMVCDATETYCVCTDCGALCASGNAVFVQMLPGIALAANPIAYCPIELGGSNTSPETVFIPIAPLSANGDLGCVSWLASPSEGEIWRSTGTPVDADPLTNDGVVDDGFIFYLSITDAQIAAAPGGITTITYTAQNDPNATACTFTSQVDWNGTVLQSDVTTAFVSASSQCQQCNADTVCDVTENYCSCIDCSSLCASAGDTFVNMTGPALSTDPIAYCPLERGLTNTTPETIMVAIAPLSANGDLGCVIWEVAPSEGEIFLSTTPPSDADPASNNGQISDGTIYFLVIDDAGILASGGMTTITYTATNDTNLPVCNFTLTIDWSGTILQSDLTAWSGSAAMQCPDVCTPLAGTLSSYDCVTNMASFDVTDAGSPPAGSNYDLIQTNDPSVSPVTVTGVGTFMVGPIDPTVTFSLGAIANNGGATDCNVQTGAIYPDCYALPTGCSDVLAGTGDMETAAAWTEVSDTTNTGTFMTGATAVANIDNTFPLADAQSAFLGGWGAATRTSLTSITQSVIFGPAGETANLIFWLQITGCDSADDGIDITIDGTSVYMTDALSAYPMTSTGAVGTCGDGHWYEITVPLGTSFSDGASHTLVITAIESGTNGAPTAFFIDEMILESCSSSPCPPEFTLANGNRLVGTESAIADYETDGSIESEQTIDATADVDYDSALDIELLPGFNTIQGALFDAFIDGCGGAMFTGGNVEQASMKQIHVVRSPANMRMLIQASKIIKPDRSQQVLSR